MQNQPFVIEKIDINGKEGQNAEVKKTHTFEETVAELGVGRFHIFILLMCGSSFLSSVNEGLALGLILPYAKCDLNMSPNEQIMLNSAGFCGIVLSSHFWGFMADTWGRRKVMQVSLITTFVFSAASSLAHTVWLMIALRFAVGLCISGVQASCIAYLGEFHSNRTRAKHVTFTAMFSPLSILYMTSIGWLIIPAQWETTLFGMIYRPWRLFILLGSCINLIAFAGISMAPDSPKFELVMGRKEQALEIIKQVYHWNTGNPKENFPIHEIEPEALGSNLKDARSITEVLAMIWTQTKPLCMPPHVFNLLRMSFLLMSLFCVAQGIYMWFPQIIHIYEENVHHQPSTLCGRMVQTNSTAVHDDCSVAPKTTIYLVFFIMGSAFIVFYVLVAMSIKHRRIIMTTWLLIVAAISIGLVFADNFILIQALLIGICSCSKVASILTAVSADLFPTQYKSMSLCLIMISARLGIVIGNIFVASIIRTTFCEFMFYLFSAIPIFCVIVLRTLSEQD